MKSKVTAAGSSPKMDLQNGGTPIPKGSWLTERRQMIGPLGCIPSPPKVLNSRYLGSMKLFSVSVRYRMPREMEDDVPFSFRRHRAASGDHDA